MDLNKSLQNLKKLMEEGKIKLLNDDNLKKSLKNVKVRHDGSVVESSVDGTIRALLLALKGAKEDKGKKRGK